jgi:hypothetical protein
VVGASHHDAAPDLSDRGDLPGAPPTFFFAPDQIRKRTEEWGPAGVEERLVAAWERFVPAAAGWVDVEVAEGPDGLEREWRAVLAGGVPPRAGKVIDLGG